MPYEVPEGATAFTYQGRQVEVVLSEEAPDQWNWFLRIDGKVHSPGDVGPAPGRVAAVLEAQVGAIYLIDSGAAGTKAREA